MPDTPTPDLAKPTDLPTKVQVEELITLIQRLLDSSGSVQANETMNELMATLQYFRKSLDRLAEVFAETAPTSERLARIGASQQQQGEVLASMEQNLDWLVREMSAPFQSDGSTGGG